MILGEWRVIEGFKWDRRVGVVIRWVISEFFGLLCGKYMSWW